MLDLSWGLNDADEKAIEKLIWASSALAPEKPNWVQWTELASVPILQVEVQPTPPLLNFLILNWLVWIG